MKVVSYIFIFSLLILLETKIITGNFCSTNGIIPNLNYILNVCNDRTNETYCSANVKTDKKRTCSQICSENNMKCYRAWSNNDDNFCVPNGDVVGKLNIPQWAVSCDWDNFEDTICDCVSLDSEVPPDPIMREVDFCGGNDVTPGLKNVINLCSDRSSDILCSFNANTNRTKSCNDICTENNMICYRTWGNRDVNPCTPDGSPGSDGEDNVPKWALPCSWDRHGDVICDCVAEGRDVPPDPVPFDEIPQPKNEHWFDKNKDWFLPLIVITSVGIGFIIVVCLAKRISSEPSIPV